MKSSLKFVALKMVALMALGFSSHDLKAACFPKAPLAYGKYYPIELRNDKGVLWQGKFYPTTSNVEVLDTKNKFMGKFEIINLTSSSSCTGPSFAKFKIKKVIGDDGDTWITIQRLAGVEQYKITLKWNGVNYIRTK